MTRKLLKFLILFDNPTLLYFPGQFVSGRVLVELEDETAVQGMWLCVSLKSLVEVKCNRWFLWQPIMLLHLTSYKVNLNRCPVLACEVTT